MQGLHEFNRGVKCSVARQGCNLLRAAVTYAVTSAVTSEGCCCGNLQIHPLDLGHQACSKQLLLGVRGKRKLKKAYSLAILL